ncbi:uncharacterized protein LOC135079546 [Ostrinia nubilalis]|uniref:uncharacterized protein LOC135079546 n=1 Tax=Ostrinia nubilalis TaxID=29057 RepID=UPI00308263CF
MGYMSGTCETALAAWKPPGNYLPRGEAPPPYDEAVAQCRPDQIRMGNETPYHRTYPTTMEALTRPEEPACATHAYVSVPRPLHQALQQVPTRPHVCKDGDRSWRPEEPACATHAYVSVPRPLHQALQQVPTRPHVCKDGDRSWRPEEPACATHAYVSVPRPLHQALQQMANTQTCYNAPLLQPAHAPEPPPPHHPLAPNGVIGFPSAIRLTGSLGAISNRALLSVAAREPEHERPHNVPGFYTSNVHTSLSVARVSSVTLTAADRSLGAISNRALLSVAAREPEHERPHNVPGFYTSNVHTSLSVARVSSVTLTAADRSLGAISNRALLSVAAREPEHERPHNVPGFYTSNVHTSLSVARVSSVTLTAADRSLGAISNRALLSVAAREPEHERPHNVPGFYTSNVHTSLSVARVSSVTLTAADRSLGAISNRALLSVAAREPEHERPHNVPGFYTSNVHTSLSVARVSSVTLTAADRSLGAISNRALLSVAAREPEHERPHNVPGFYTSNVHTSLHRTIPRISTAADTSAFEACFSRGDRALHAEVRRSFHRADRERDREHAREHPRDTGRSMPRNLNLAERVPDPPPLDQSLVRLAGGRSRAHSEEHNVGAEPPPPADVPATAPAALAPAAPAPPPHATLPLTVDKVSHLVPARSFILLHRQHRPPGDQ